MSSSSSTAGPNRTRSLRQPTAGLSKLTKRDETKKALPLELRHKAALPSPTASSVAESSGHSSPSRLPKPGAPSSIARPGAASSVTLTGSSAAAGASTGTRSRPNSGISGLSRSNTTATRKPLTKNLAAEEAEPVKTTRTLPTPGTRLTRPKSMVGPSSQPPPPSSSRAPSTITTGPATASATKLQSPRPTARARAKSTATSLNSTNILRPPPPPSAVSTAPTSTTGTAATAASKRPLGRANTVTTRAQKQRQASGASSTANTSALSATSSTTATAKPSKQSATDDHPPRLRPAFNTLQQHYSPARNLAPKPSTASYLAPPTPSKLPANVALSTETAKLQTELLQLHLLHRDADAVSASWHASAKQRLGNRFTDLVRVNEEVVKEEAAVAETQNLAALKSWAESGDGKSLEDQVQTLDSVLSGLWSLSEPGGRYGRVVRNFEKWVDQMKAAVEARQKAGGLGALMDSGEVTFINELDPAWKDEVSSLARKLDGWRRQLGQLAVRLPATAVDEQQRASSLVKIVTGCQSQVYDMLAELDIMEQIERDAFGQEAAWIRRMNREDAADDTPGAGAIWRAF